MKLIALAALAGLLAAGCASHKANQGGTYDTTGSTPGFGAERAEPGGTDTPPNPDTGKTPTSDTSGIDNPSDNTTATPNGMQISPNNAPESSATEPAPDEETSPNQEEISPDSSGPNSSDSGDVTPESDTPQGGSSGVIEPDESNSPDTGSGQASPESGTGNTGPGHGFRHTVLTIRI